MTFKKWFVDVTDTDSGECYVRSREHLSASLAVNTMVGAAEYYQARDTKVMITLRSEEGYLITTFYNYETSDICRNEQQAGESPALLVNSEWKVNRSINRTSTETTTSFKEQPLRP